jgi:hypothetical protein
VLSRFSGALVLALVLGVAASFTGPAAAARPLVTGIFAESSAASFVETHSRIRLAGSSVVRITAFWPDIAPPAPPPGFDPADPGAPGYRWETLDGQVAAAATQGLAPILVIVQTPEWARAPGTPASVWAWPDPGQLASFFTAAGRRYNGTFVPPGHTAPLPAVRRWEIWNEPNLAIFFRPQYGPGGESVAPAHYREMLNASAAALHGVSPGNVVVAGATSPFGGAGDHTPKAFLRRVLCVGGSPLRSVCPDRAEFDAWSHHPYTQGGPTHHAFGAENVSIGDLPELRRLLTLAQKLGKVQSPGPVGFWVTEFSWDTSPPDPRGVRSTIHARWTAEALYRMWHSGVSLVSWWLVRDKPWQSSPFQSGFYFCGAPTTADDDLCAVPSSRDVRKRSFQAFRFPFVAFRRPAGVYTWGRTPFGTPGRVIVEQKAGARWRRLGAVRTDRFGIFQRTWWKAARTGSLRARLAGGERSLAFSLRPVPDRFIELTFGCGGGLPC